MLSFHNSQQKDDFTSLEIKIVKKELTHHHMMTNSANLNTKSLVDTKEFDYTIQITRKQGTGS